MAAAEDLLNTAVRHQVYLERLKSGQVGQFEAYLKRIDKSIRDRLTKADLTGYQRARLEKLLGQVDKDLAAIYGEFQKQLDLDLSDLAEYEAGFEHRALTSLGREVGISGSFTLPAAAQVVAAVKIRPLSVKGPDGGKLLDAFIGDWTRSERTRVIGAIRQGYFEGQTTQEVIRAIRGTRANRFNDGILAITNRNSEAVVRTSMQHVANGARMETWAANDELIDGYRWVSTLDGRTSVQCRSLDGQTFKLNKGPVPPIHVRCRSTTIPEIKGVELGDTTRASKDGPVSASDSYYDWLKNQPAAFQDDVIGPVRGKLLRDGGLSSKRFAELQLGKNFRPMTLEDMRKAEPLAFERALGE